MPKFMDVHHGCTASRRKLCRRRTRPILISKPTRGWTSSAPGATLIGHGLVRVRSPERGRSAQDPRASGPPSD